jgi:hypothetical protein
MCHGSEQGHSGARFFAGVEIMWSGVLGRTSRHSWGVSPMLAFTTSTFHRSTALMLAPSLRRGYDTAWLSLFLDPRSATGHREEPSG